MTDWKSIIKTVAPGIAGLLGGPLAATAVGALSQSLLGKDNGTADEVAAVVAGASPDVLAKIKQTEADLKVKLAQSGVDLENIAASDRASARQREISLKDKTVPLLAMFYTVAYFGALWSVWHYGMPSDPDTRAVLNNLLGVITTVQVTIVAYYFGSSKGSADKTALLSK